MRALESPPAALRATSAVPSVEASSMTTSSRFGYVVERIEVTQRPMLCASLRAGTITVTSCAFSGASSLSSLSERECRSRT